MLQGENNKSSGSGSTSDSHNSSGSSGGSASVAVTVAIPVGPDWAILERNFWPKRANKASDADRLAVKMRIAEVTVVHRLYVSATFPGTASNYLTNANTYSEVADILDGLFDGSA